MGQKNIKDKKPSNTQIKKPISPKEEYKNRVIPIIKKDNVIIIGIAGCTRCGKSTLAKNIETQYLLYCSQENITKDMLFFENNDLNIEYQHYDKLITKKYQKYVKTINMDLYLSRILAEEASDPNSEYYNWETNHCTKWESLHTSICEAAERIEKISRKIMIKMKKIKIFFLLIKV